MSSALLPPNSTPLERALADTPQLDRLTPEVVARLWNPATCPAAHLPWLAWALSVDDWDGEWPEALQRRVIADSIVLHRKKGTMWAVRRALEQTGYRGQVVEWWQDEPAGVPHTFRLDVEISERGIDAGTIAAIERRIDQAKPVRSHYTLRTLARLQAPVRCGAAILGGDTISILPYTVTAITVPPAPGPRHAITTHDWMTTEIRPQ